MGTTGGSTVRESRALVQLSRELLGTAWRHGWQPADLHRYLGRTQPSGVLTTLPDAMADEVRRYPADAVDPRWTAQLEELGAAVWWSRDTDFPRARWRREGGDWGAVYRAVRELLLALSRLPELERIGPLPGEATATARDATRRAGAVDDRILSRVRALLAKAESTTFEAEAETFTAGAQALMSRHSIDAAMLDAADPQDSAPEAVRIGVDRPYEHAKALLLSVVADANRCRAVWSQQFGFSTVLGFGPDLRAVETLFTSLLVQVTAAVRREGPRTDLWGASRTRAFRQSFLTSYAHRIGERLQEVADEAVHQAVQRASEGPGSRQAGGGATPAGGAGAVLLPVLAARSLAVQEATAAMFPGLVQRSASRVTDPEGWHRGRAAADRADLARGEGLDRGSA